MGITPDEEFAVHENGRPSADDTSERVADLLRLAHTALSRATAVLFRSTTKAEKGMAAVGRALGELWGEAEDLTWTGLAAGAAQDADLRTVITDMYVGEDIGRMGVLTRQVSDIAWARQSKPPLPTPVWECVRELGESSLALVGRAHDAIASPASPEVTDAELAEVGGLQRRLCRTLLSGIGSLDVIDAVDTAILGRCYAECAQRATAVAQHMCLLRETPMGG
ncbi:hypothetical protein [Streptomyces sp. C36]|uniref:hypothetical protein n=1 Tax=Streptomyces sp. C36 TaxID=3237122 RepID=UPI0034C687FE